MVAYIIDATEHHGYAKARHSLPILVGDRLLWLLAIVVTNTTLTPTHAASRRKAVDDGRHGFLGGDRAVRTVTSAAMHVHARLDINAIYFRVANAVQGSPSVDRLMVLARSSCHTTTLSQLRKPSNRLCFCDRAPHTSMSIHPTCFFGLSTIRTYVFPLLKTL
jgi:hypothetical protein